MKSNNQPLISVIMPTYNHGKFIKEAINSILNQTYRNLELIIIDNYSKDDTEAIVSSFKDDRMKYLKFRNYGIISASRNFGVKNSQGDYITFIDSDDLWFSEKLNIQLNYLKNNSDIALVCSNLKINSSDERYNKNIAINKSKSESGYFYNRLINSNFILCSSVMMRSFVLNEIGYFDENPKIVPSDDWDLWLRIARKYKIAFIPEIVGVYRIHNFNFSKNVERLPKILYAIDKHCKNGWITQKQADRAKANFYFREGWFLIDKDVKISKSFFYHALQNDKKNIKLYCLCRLGLFLSAFPFLCKAIKRKALDKKIGNWIVNPHNL